MNAEQTSCCLPACRPPGRTHPFSEELIADVAGVRTTLAQLTGACTGTELSLASDSLPFGTVVLGSRTSKRLQLSNTGDVGTKFVWETKALGPNFTIYPAGEPPGCVVIMTKMWGIL